MLTFVTTSSNRQKSLAEMNGLEQLQHALVDNPSAGIVELVNMSIDRIERGVVEFTIRPDETMTNPIGTVHGGIASTLLDSVASCAVHSVLEPGQRYATTQLNIHLTRAIRADGTPIRGVGEVVHLGRTGATASGTLTDPDGRVVAHGSVTCAITP